MDLFILGIVFVSYFISKLVSSFADDEIFDSKKYLIEVLFVVQSYILYYITLESLFALSFYILSRLIRENSFYLGILFSVFLTTLDVVGYLLAILYFFFLGLYEHKLNLWKLHILMFGLSILFFTLL